MAAELFPTKKLVPSASASSTSLQQYQQQNATNNNITTAAAKGCCNWQGLYPTIRERSVWGPGCCQVPHRPCFSSWAAHTHREAALKKHGLTFQLALHHDFSLYTTVAAVFSLQV